jgi:hypothetical protein
MLDKNLKLKLKDVYFVFDVENKNLNYPTDVKDKV